MVAATPALVKSPLLAVWSISQIFTFGLAWHFEPFPLFGGLGVCLWLLTAQLDASTLNPPMVCGLPKNIAYGNRATLLTAK